MFIRRVLYGLSFLFITLGFFGVVNAAQTTADAPIIARVGSGLYAVSPISGEARLLDEVSPDLDALLQTNYAGYGIRLDSLSPDNTLLAYTTALGDLLNPDYADVQKPLAQRAPNDVYVVDVVNGERRAVTSQASTFAEVVGEGVVENYHDLTWSLDGSRLYFVAEGRPWDNRPTTRSLYYYDVAAGTTHEVGDLLRPPLTADNQFIGLYPVREGIAALHALDYNGNFRFVVFGEDDRIINQFDIQLMGIQDVNAWMFDYNPIHTGDKHMFGYFTIGSDGPLPSVLDLPSGSSEAVSPSGHVTVVSHAAPSSSLRIVLESLLVGDVPWVVADKDGNHLMTLDTVVYGKDAAIAPDGATMAYLGARGKTGVPRDILIFDGSESRSLGFAANEILWGAVEYSFADMR